MKSNPRRHPAWRLNPVTAALFASASSVALPMPVAAQVQELTPITVTGENSAAQSLQSSKFTAPLRDTPQTVTVIPESIYRQQGAQTLNDVFKNIPGISFSGGENGFAANTNTFNLRGFDASQHIFIDGARDSGAYSRDIFNVEQVEVAKGAAADNGRGGAGGYLNLVTKSPRLENFAAGSASYGVDEYSAEDRRRVSADVNRKFGNSTAARLNLLWLDGGKAGRDQVELKTWGVAPSLALGLGTDMRAVLSFQHIRQDDIPDYGVPGITIPGTYWHGVNPGPDYSAVSRDRYYGSLSDFNEVTANSGLLRLEYDWSETTTLSNRTRWGDTEHRALFTQISNADPAAAATAADEANVNRFRAGYWRDNTSVSNTTNLSTAFDTGGLRHALSAGIELSREKTDAVRQGLIGVAPAADLVTSIFNPDNSPLAGALDPAGDTSAINIDTLAAYVYDTVALNPRWQLTGGVRVERYEVEILSSDPVTDLKGRETTVGGKLGVVYKPAANGSVYASVSRAVELPGDYLSTPDISRTGANGLPGLTEGVNDPDNKPRVSVNLELGTKWNLFEERLLLSAAAFITEKRNVAITGREAGETSATLKGYGRQIVEGVELGANGRISEAWSVFGGVVLLDSERKHSAFLDEVRCRDASGDYGGDGVPEAICGITRTSGDQLAFTPEVSANLWTTYRTATGLTLGLGGQHVGKQVAGRPSDASRIVKNGKFGTLPSYTVINALASYAVNSNLTLRMNIDNLFDEKYAMAANWSARTVELGSSRAVLFSADWMF